MGVLAPQPLAQDLKPGGWSQATGGMVTSPLSLSASPPHEVKPRGYFRQERSDSNKAQVRSLETRRFGAPVEPWGRR